MNKLLTAGALTACLALTMPVATWANNNIEETVTTAQFESALPCVTDMTTKYSFDGINIRKEPNTSSEILGKTLLNTEFETVLDLSGWTMITTKNGYAYIKSEYLSDTEIKYSKEDLYVMAHVIAGEAQICDDVEKRYVGSVVLNRVNHKEFPNTIKDVVFQKKQYSSVSDRNYYREPTENDWLNAKWVLENGSILPAYVIYQSKGKQGKGIYLKTKWHQYCY